jgi:ATP-dependent helicase IRC3
VRTHLARGASRKASTDTSGVKAMTLEKKDRAAVHQTILITSMQCLRNRTPILLSFFRRHGTATTILLRPYQEQCLDACIDALDGGSTRIGVSLPTGSGKTTVFVSLLSRLSPPSTNQDATRSIIIVNSIELARQSAEQVARLFPHWHVEIEQGAKHQASGLADVYVRKFSHITSKLILPCYYSPARSRPIRPSIM